MEQAVARGLALAAHSNPVLVVYEKLAPVQKLLCECWRGARRPGARHGARGALTMKRAKRRQEESTGGRPGGG